MKRRDVLAGAGALALTGCAGEQQECKTGDAGQTYSWKMVTTWPPNCAGVGTGVVRLAKFIEDASNGRLRIKVYAAGELVPAFEVFDTVSRGTAEIGHGAAYYWKGKSEAAQFFTALQTGSIDATEWIGPYNDVAFGLHKAARYYYYPGWQEPGPVLECIVNKQAFEELPKDLQTIVEIACSAINDQMTAEYTARNATALEQLRSDGEVELRKFPDDVMTQLRDLTLEVVDELVAKDPVAARINESFSNFRRTVGAWTEISEQAMLDSRSL